jgi:flagellin-like protein
MQHAHEDDRAVSAVIGVILMVAITVVMAAVIGTFVLDLGQNVQSNPQAGVNFEQGDLDGQADGPDVGITVNSVQRADSIEYSCAGGSWQPLSASAGASATCNDLAAGDEVVVRATFDGNSAIVQRTSVDD